jgi:hypothetical protein
MRGPLPSRDGIGGRQWYFKRRHLQQQPGRHDEIDRSTLTGLSNAGGIVFTFFNNEASMIIGANAPVGQYGLVNSNTFNNKGCATLQLFAPLNNTLNFSASFTNGGLFTVSTTGVHGNTGLLTNNGVIVYPQGNPIPNVINNELIVLPPHGHRPDGCTRPANRHQSQFYGGHHLVPEPCIHHRGRQLRVCHQYVYGRQPGQLSGVLPGYRPGQRV